MSRQESKQQSELPGLMGFDRILLVNNKRKNQLMPPHKCARYNIEFAKAVIKAFFAGHKSFSWNKHHYVVDKHVNDVCKDVSEGWYKFDISFK